MGIRKIQITRRVEEIIKSYLYRGRYPTFQTITHHFGQWLRDYTPGAPVFQPLKVFRKEPSSSEKYNNHVAAIHQDITDAYEATISQTTQIMSDFNFVEVERGKILHELSSLSKSIDDLLIMSTNADFKYFDGHSISFEDSGYVNKEMSSVLVNVQNQEVTLLENKSKSNRIYIQSSNAVFKPLQPASKSSALESIKNAFDDNMNTAWWHVIKTKELSSDNQMKAELIVMFDAEESLNSIEYAPHHGKPVNTKIEYTLDGVSFFSINQQAETDKITGHTVWNFQQISAKGIRFVFEKSDYDERSGDYYNYYFGAKNIGFYKKNYLSKGIMYSTPIEFTNDIQELSLIAKHEIPFNTEVQYEIALYDPNVNTEDLIWHAVSSANETKPKHATVINVNVKESKKIETNKAEATSEIINGMRVFRLMKDNGDGIMSETILDTQTGETAETFDTFQNPKLFRGINQWKRERTYVSFDGSIPLNQKWDDQYLHRPEVITMDYLPKGNRLDLKRNNSGVADNFYRFSISVYSDEQRNQPLSLSVISTLSSGTRQRLGSYSVYVNRKRLVPVNDEVTMNFIQGWNEIQILYHWGNMQERKDVPVKDLPTETLVGKFNFAAEKRIRGDFHHMTYVDSHSLFHNISPHNHNNFAIHERQVVLNYLPNNCVFQLTYETSKQIEQHNQVIVRVLLTRDIDIPHITPKIYSIQLRAK